MGTSALSPISLRLKEFREGKGLSQAELARRSGVSQSTISRIEAGETGGISLANLEGLADALGVNAALLIVHEPKAGKRGTDR
jgi:transcriptional regulator with XRE-family HTH domain